MHFRLTHARILNQLRNSGRPDWLKSHAYCSFYVIEHKEKCTVCLYWVRMIKFKPRACKCTFHHTQHAHVVYWDCSGFQNNRFMDLIISCALPDYNRVVFWLSTKTRLHMYEKNNHYEHINIKNGKNVIIRPFVLLFQVFS